MNSSSSLPNHGHFLTARTCKVPAYQQAHLYLIIFNKILATNTTGSSRGSLKTPQLLDLGTSHLWGDNLSLWAHCEPTVYTVEPPHTHESQNDTLRFELKVFTCNILSEDKE